MTTFISAEHVGDTQFCEGTAPGGLLLGKARCRPAKKPKKKKNM